MDPTTPRPVLRAVPGSGPDVDQVLRLRRFRDQHPDVMITGGPFWQAVIPEENGEQVITRYDLRTLLDRLESPGAESAPEPA